MTGTPNSVALASFDPAPSPATRYVVFLLIEPEACQTHLVPLLQLEPQRWYMLTGALGLLIAWRSFRAVLNPIPSHVRAAVAHCILSMVMLDAICCFSVRGVAWACLIFAFFLPSLLLGRWIKMT